MARAANPLVQSAVAVLAALALSLLMQTEAFRQFTHALHLRDAIGIATFPAILVAYMIGGHEASTEEYTIGLVFQFLAMLWLGRLAFAAYRKLESSLTP